ncbi:heat stress transcription factor A-5 [Lathyrus oleraceus]|uniref:HSF-type DNA-binding domain-containing protein n=1 Tax=Pisum sativum TaxID=3888 RepID=A0A9D5AI40_PEA|nr:heat stress transcription factor A-5-like [Pisum sativum]KAI5406430.1 hypothetical protein KIW84_052961 [Pisum sativum]
MGDSTMESGAGSSGGLTKFLVKTLQLVDDPSTDDIISWSPNNNSFIIKDTIEFAKNFLKNYFKHENFSSFVRQLNTYGFHKINHDKWEFANEYFRKDQYYLLSNIRRKKTVHRHSRGEVERSTFEKEIEKLSNEKASIELDISNFKQKMPAKKLHVENLMQRLEALEKRHNNLKNSFEMILQNPILVEKMNKKIEFIFSLRFSNKRPFPDVAENAFVENDSYNGALKVGNSMTDNDSNLGLMEVGNDFTDIDTNYEFLNFEDIFDENGNNFESMEEGENAHHKVMERNANNNNF